MKKSAASALTIEQFNHQKIGAGEKVAYGLANLGGNICNTFIASFITLYYTDSVGLAAAAVGTMMLIARIFDAISDIVMGGIIDKTHTRIGQARPWFLISILPLSLLSILVFTVPESFGSVMDHIVDRFGEDVETFPVDGKTFQASVLVTASKPFFGWVFGFDGKVRITSPAKVKRDYEKMLQRAAEPV